MPTSKYTKAKLLYTPCTIIIFQNKHGDIIKGASPWRNKSNKLCVSIMPRRMDRQQKHIVNEKTIIAFFEVSRLMQVDQLLESNFKPRFHQQIPKNFRGGKNV